ncbi:MAG: hypothetical protein M1483_06905 [Actinobacteria bacterium]|nr:hypothetical protein [Actinomycetota bacterium]MCL6105337.1 hypothetical protein [Actinomycetota bacterium]
MAEKPDIKVRELIEKINSKLELSRRRILQPLQASEELISSTDAVYFDYLNTHWATAPLLAPRSSLKKARSLKGFIRAVFERFLFTTMYDYLQEQQEFHANVVRAFNSLNSRVTTLAESSSKSIDALYVAYTELLDLIEEQHV